MIARGRALAQHYGLGTSPVHLMSGTFDMRTDKVTQSHLIDVARDLDVGWVVIDTLARAMAGGDENSAQDMGAIIDNVGELQSKLHTHVTLIHHTGKDASRGARGSSALKPALDLEIEVTGKTGERIRTAKVTKSKNTLDVDPMSFVIEGIELHGADGHPILNSWDEPMSVGIIKKPDVFEEQSLAKAKVKLRDRDQQMLRTLQRMLLLDNVRWPDLQRELKAKNWESHHTLKNSWSKTFSRSKESLLNGFVVENRDGSIELANWPGKL